ncbi:unnamed protein product [Mytilus coruscus]|uniref:Uncharacterized protein n=1 Tax=Mytilus coruscus TaxID=42192 RepID=A0A6J8CX49_MYTCO|nr:unnamed protein product [Mytilus coruscus]
MRKTFSNIYNTYGETDLNVYITSGESTLIDAVLTLKHKIRIDKQHRLGGGTPVSYAASCGYLEILRYLLTLEYNKETRPELSGTLDTHEPHYTSNTNTTKQTCQIKSHQSNKGQLPGSTNNLPFPITLRKDKHTTHNRYSVTTQISDSRQVLPATYSISITIHINTHTPTSKHNTYIVTYQTHNSHKDIPTTDSISIAIRKNTHQPANITDILSPIRHITVTRFYKQPTIPITLRKGKQAKHNIYIDNNQIHDSHQILPGDKTPFDLAAKKSFFDPEKRKVMKYLKSVMKDQELRNLTQVLTGKSTLNNKNPNDGSARMKGTTSDDNVIAMDMSEDDIFRLLRSECTKGNYEMVIVPIDLWDFGGQKIYQMTHQLFITSRGTFLVIFNGSKGIHEEIPDYTELPGCQGQRNTAGK